MPTTREIFARSMGNPALIRDPNGSGYIPDPSQDRDNYIPPVPTSSKGQEEPKKSVYQHGEGDYTEGAEFPEPEPPRPTDEMKDRAKAGEETDEEREIIRNWRAWAGRKGDWENQELSQGRIPKMKVSRLNMISNYGSDFANIDLDGRRVWTTMSGVPDGKGGVTPDGGGWIPMDKQTYEDVMKYRSERDSDRGQQVAKMLGLKDTQQYAAVARMREMDSLVGRQHWQKDPATGYYFAVHKGGTGLGQENEDPNSWEWFDQAGRPVSGPPQGALGKFNMSGGKRGVNDNYYYLNRMSEIDPSTRYALPGQQQVKNWFDTMPKEDPVKGRTPLPPIDPRKSTRTTSQFDPTRIYQPRTNPVSNAWGGVSPVQAGNNVQKAAPVNTPERAKSQLDNDVPAVPKKKKNLTGTQGMLGGIKTESNTFGTY